MQDESLAKINTTPIRKGKKGKKKRNVPGQHTLQQSDPSAIRDVVVHESDPNEPRYCYCNNVSYGAVRVVFPCFVFPMLTACLRWSNVKTP